MNARMSRVVLVIILLAAISCKLARRLEVEVEKGPLAGNVTLQAIDINNHHDQVKLVFLSVGRFGPYEGQKTPYEPPLQTTEAIWAIQAEDQDHPPSISKCMYNDVPAGYIAQKRGPPLKPGTYVVFASAETKDKDTLHCAEFFIVYDDLHVGMKPKKKAIEKILEMVFKRRA